ncbi:cysteine dioxygenase [Metabacillus litoralis]|uniref:cysteine dioxygenase n=1 Tax=Metabacillus litoralis TaxID=152268 RepID=UPI001CFD7D15|nr:cysteine dioxygenase family protein [Metabacillus litoralis]
MRRSISLDVKNRIDEVLQNVEDYSKEGLKQSLKNLNIQYRDLEDILIRSDTAGKPYYRKLLFKNDCLELLVMDWSELECSPHDHGQSYGWIQVIKGTAKNTVYEMKGDQFPIELLTELQEEGKLFFAPHKGIHKMAVSKDSNLVTLHLYSPPITGMKVFDLEKCAACIVSDDCGAWWPDDQTQKVKEIKLRKN